MGSTVMSEDFTLLMGLGVGGDVKSRRDIRRRLIVPLGRRTASVTVDRTETDRRVFHGRAGCAGCDEGVLHIFWDRNC